MAAPGMSIARLIAAAAPVGSTKIPAMSPPMEAAFQIKFPQ